MSSSEGQCPFEHGGRTTAKMQSNADWWPNRLNLKILSQHSAKADPMDPDFDYAKAFRALDRRSALRRRHAPRPESRKRGPPLGALA